MVNFTLKEQPIPSGDAVNITLVPYGAVPTIATISLQTPSGLKSLSIIENQGNDQIQICYEANKIGTANLVDPLSDMASPIMVCLNDETVMSWAYAPE